MLFMPPLAAAQTTVRLGAPTGTAREEFTNVSSIVELSGGRVLVADDREQRIVVVDFSSPTVRVIGRRGAGPGEFAAVGMLLPRPGGGAYLSDFAQRRLLPVNDDGTFENPIPFAASIALHGADARGWLYGNSFLSRTPAGVPDSMWIVRWDPRAGVIDTIMKYNAMVSAAITRPGEARRVFPPVDTWSVLPGGEILLLTASTYRATVWTDGKHSRSANIPWQPVRFTDADGKAFERAARESPPVMMGQGGGAPPTAPRLPQLRFPEIFPPFGGDGLGGRYITTSPSGHAWVRRLRTVNDSLAFYDVIDTQSLALVARVELGPRETLVSIGRGVVYTHVKDADGVATLRRYVYPVFTPR
jgi:hypothetical protein